MMCFASKPVALAPCVPMPEVPAWPSGLVVDAPPCPAAGTCAPAIGGSTVVAFLGHPVSSAAAANRQAIEIILFMEFPSTLNASVPANAAIVYCVESRPASKRRPGGLLHLALARHQAFLHATIRSRERENAAAAVAARIDDHRTVRRIAR